jgi:hypothetical protein
VTTKNLEYYVNSVDKAEAGFEMNDSNFETSSLVDKIVSNSNVCYRKIFRETKSQSIQRTSLLSFFNKLPQPFNLRQPSPWSAVINIDANPSINKKITIR